MSKSKTQKILLFLFLLCTFYFVQRTLLYGQNEVKYDSAGRRNPFIPLITPEGVYLKLDNEAEGEQELLLEGIIYDKQGLSYAVVNGTVVKVGDSIMGYQVLKIEDNKVIFIKEGQQKEMVLKKEEGL